MITRTMRYRFNAGADLRKVKSALNRTITICRKAKLFDLAQEALKTKNNLIRGHKWLLAENTKKRGASFVITAIQCCTGFRRVKWLFSGICRSFKTPKTTLRSVQGLSHGASVKTFPITFTTWQSSNLRGYKWKIPQFLSCLVCFAWFGCCSAQ